MNSKFAVIMSAMAGYSAIGQAAVKRTAEGPKGTQRAAKEARIADASCKEICQKAPIPKALAKALDTIVQSAKDKGVALKLTKLKIVANGKLEAKLNAEIIEKTASGAENAVKKDKKEIVKGIASGDPNWELQDSSSIKLRTTKILDPLAGPSKPTDGFLSRTGISVSDESSDLSKDYSKIEKHVLGWFESHTGIGFGQLKDKALLATEFIANINPVAAAKLKMWKSIRLIPPVHSDAKMATAVSELRDLSSAAQDLASRFSGDTTLFGDLSKDHQKSLRRFDRWFNMIEGTPTDDLSEETVLNSHAIVSALKQLSSRADNLQKIKDWKHYRISGMRFLVSEAGKDLGASLKAAAHVRYTGKVERYLDSKKRVLYQVNSDRVVILDPITAIASQYLPAYYIHEWIHAQNALDGIRLRNEDNKRIAHASQIDLDKSATENLTFSAALLNSSSWFSYIAKKDEQKAIRSTLNSKERRKARDQIFPNQS